jgi:hypothetical protein
MAENFTPRERELAMGFVAQFVMACNGSLRSRRTADFTRFASFVARTHTHRRKENVGIHDVPPSIANTPKTPEHLLTSNDINTISAP